MRVLLARHGQTDWNAAGRIQGASDVPLNENGREQARQLASKLAASGGRLGAIYSSPLKRALETAGIIGRELGISPVSERALMELSFGDWEGCSWDEIGRRWPEQFAAYSADRRNYAPPNGESYAEMLGRAWPFVDALRSVAESYKRIKLPNGALAELGSLE